MPSSAPSYRRIFAVVREIPLGRVATYGQVAALAGLPGHARQVGYALHGCDEELPWHRVINAQGRVSPRAEPEWEQIQMNLLRDEGIEVDLSGRIDLRRFRWNPDQ